MAEQLLQRKHWPTSESVVYQLLCVCYLPVFSHLNSIQIDAKFYASFLISQFLLWCLLREMVVIHGQKKNLGISIISKLEM